MAPARALGARARPRRVWVCALAAALAFCIPGSVSWCWAGVRSSYPLTAAGHHGLGHARLGGDVSCASKKPHPNRQNVRKQGKAKKLQALQTLQICGGRCKSHKLLAPGVFLRPMMQTVRESLFSMLGSFDVLGENCSALDLFSGSGIVGFEAVSRGVGNVTFVDSSSACTSTITKNSRTLSFENRTRVITHRVNVVLDSPGSFGINYQVGLVTMTPPYQEVSYPELLVRVAESGVLAEDALVVVEYPVELGMLPSELFGGQWLGYRNRRFGRTVLALYVCRPSGGVQAKRRIEEFKPLPEYGIATIPSLAPGVVVL